MRESNDPVATGTPSGDRDTTGWDTQTDRTDRGHEHTGRYRSFGKKMPARSRGAPF